MMIIKIGGGEGINLEAIVDDLAALQEPFLVVHGANALRDTSLRLKQAEADLHEAAEKGWPLRIQRTSPLTF